jgi:D-glycero-alpha-D-manno-heptose-7-phosphate kinase
MQVSSEGSVRVDLVGGTLDIFPLNLIIPNAITLNVATSLKARVTLTSRSDQEILIRSQDYQKDYQFPLNKITETKKNNPEMKFILELIELFKPSTGMLLELASGAPAGSGLGGSSAMGVTLYKALSEFFNQSFDVTTTVAKVKDTEAKILNQGVPGYQDYYPALMGGVLALKGAPGEIVVEQLYNEGLKNFLEDHITLVFSGVSRQS